MNNIKFLVIAFLILAFSGCAALIKNLPVDADQTSQLFFDDLQRNNYQAAYQLFARGLSNRVSFDQFEQFMQTIREQWGRVETDETVLLPFHTRMGEANFIPLDVKPQQVKRYTFDVKFSNAEMNIDLTLAPEEGKYKIVWFSVWGSSIYMTPQVQEKIEQLFASPDVQERQ